MPGGVAGLMVGRDRELDQVTLLLDEALAGRGRLVLCTGEAGIGKTRLAEELTANAATRNMPAVWARAADRDSSPPYGLWRLALAEPAINTSSNGDADVWQRTTSYADGEASNAQRFALFAEVRRRLTQAAGHAGLLLVLDDLQWADEASQVLLADVVRQLRGTRILLFATCRDTPTQASTDNGTLLKLATDANTERVALHGLPTTAVAQLLRAAGLPKDPDQAAGVYQETGGNPFLVREVAHMLTGQRSTSGPAIVPGRVLESTGSPRCPRAQPTCSGPPP